MTLFRNERQFMNAIASNARQLGFLVYHPEISQRSERGYPDLTIAGHGIIRFIETKGPKGRVSEQQQAWIDTLTACGANARIAWMDDFDEVMRDLETAYEAAFTRRSEEQAA